MGQSAPSPSDNNVHPRSLAERLKGVAERLKVEADGEPPGEPSLGQTAEQSLHLAPGRGPWVSNTLLAVLIVVSLVPTAIIGAMFWQGLLRTPWSTNLVVSKDSRPLEAQQASPASTLAETVQPKQDVEDLSVSLTAPATIEAEGDKAVPFGIAVNSANAIPFRSTVTIQGLPEGTTLSRGRPYGETEWTLRPDEIGDLHLLLPKTASGHPNLRIALVAADGTTIASAATQLNIAENHKTALITRPDESERIADLIAHGQKMIDVGYLPGARGYFQRAAEAGSAEAAYALGATYDPSFIHDSGAQGIKGDLAQARAWYERARELGSQAAQERLQELTKSVAAKRAQGPNE
jgi:hypothetical protein